MSITQLTFRFKTSRLPELLAGEPLIHILVIRHQRRGIGHAAIVGASSRALPCGLVFLSARSIGTIRRSEVEKTQWIENIVIRHSLNVSGTFVRMIDVLIRNTKSSCEILR